jgi:radical SAM protein with 4Fe4S-binding SPASM domain
MKPGIILVHGYSGSNYDLKPLADKLAAHFGEDSVINLLLPGHVCTPVQENIPEFNASLFCGFIHQTIASCRKEGRKIILIGHSTGGSLVLSSLRKFSIIPDLLILVSVPKKIDSGYFARWELHRGGKKSIPLIDVAMMVKLINQTGAQQFATEFPVLVIQGENDRLVPSTEAHAWKNESFDSARVVTIPGADHDLFKSINCHLAADIIRRAVADIALSACKDSNIINSLIAVEPELKDFFKAAPLSKNHLALCPSGQSVIDQKPELAMTAKTDPVIANIEITTFCNLYCQFCARSQLKKNNKHMSFKLFRNILAVLPNTYKIVLVGLGETLLHPQAVDFIRYAKSLGKKVGIVTNAMLLNEKISEQLLGAGLDSIAFSIDGSDADLSSVVRKGTDFYKVVRNIKQFVQIANSRRISKAVFSAVSTDTVAHLKDLIDTVSELGVDVLMLSDINFKANLDHTLWQNVNAQMETAVKQAISHAFAKKLPVLSVHGLEEFGLEKRYHDFLMIPPAELYQRSKHHTWCFSPWQTIPVDVDGNITLCDCQPDFVVGNLLRDSFSDIWNGETLKKYRTEMLSKTPPEACQICPRF